MLWDEAVYKYQLDPVLLSHSLDDFVFDGSTDWLNMGVRVIATVYLSISLCRAITVLHI